MTQLDKLNNSLLPAHQQIIQLWVQFCCHLQDLNWSPGLHEERGAIDLRHLAQIVLEAVRLVGMGHKAEFRPVHCTGAGSGTVYQVAQPTLLKQLQQGSHADTYRQLTMVDDVAHMICMLRSVPDSRRLPCRLGEKRLSGLHLCRQINQNCPPYATAPPCQLEATCSIVQRENCAAAGCMTRRFPKHEPAPRNGHTVHSRQQRTLPKHHELPSLDEDPHQPPRLADACVAADHKGLKGAVCHMVPKRRVDFAHKHVLSVLPQERDMHRKVQEAILIWLLGKGRDGCCKVLHCFTSREHCRQHCKVSSAVAHIEQLWQRTKDGNSSHHAGRQQVLARPELISAFRMQHCF